MLDKVHIVQWFMLFVAFILYLGPGALIGSLLKIRLQYSLTCMVEYAIYSSSFWIILLNLFRVLRLYIIEFYFVFGICCISWILFILLNRNQLKFPSSLSLNQVLLGITLLLASMVIIYSLRDQVAGLGSDSFHHTLIPQMIIWHKGLPNDYSPVYPDIITLNYHAGFHVVVAILSILSGWETRLIVLIMIPALVIGSGLAIYNFVRVRSEDDSSALLAAIVPMFLFAFPVGMLEWGRYPQTLGLIVLIIFISEYLKWFREPSTLNERIYALALLASTIVYTHYRVALMALIGMLFWEIGYFISCGNFVEIRTRVKSLTKIGFVTLIFILPLLLNFTRNVFTGFADPINTPTSEFFELERLGAQNLTYFPNIVTCLLFIFSLINSIRKKDRVSLWLFIWWLSILLFAILFRRLFSYTLDPITVSISLYLPVAIIVGLGFSNTLPSKMRNNKRTYAVLMAVIICLGGIFLHNRLAKSVPLNSFVNQDDLTASKWIREHVTPDECFVVSTYNFNFSSNFIIGSDGGWWLPVLAQRCVITYPMTTNIERFNHPNALNKTVQFHSLNGNLDNEIAVNLLQIYKTHYVYVSTRKNIGGSVIDPIKLMKSPYYELVYKNRSVYIFRLSNNGFEQNGSPDLSE